MRITWKDSLAVTKKSFKYRKHLISPYKDGWIVDLPDDNNIYANQYCVKNAVDLALGVKSQAINAKLYLRNIISSFCTTLFAFCW